MEEMIDINNCPCGATIESGDLNIVPLLAEREPGLHQIQCRKCGRRGIISADIDLVCSTWNDDFSYPEKD